MGHEPGVVDRGRACDRAGDRNLARADPEAGTAGTPSSPGPLRDVRGRGRHRLDGRTRPPGGALLRLRENVPGYRRAVRARPDLRPRGLPPGWNPDLPVPVRGVRSRPRRAGTVPPRRPRLPDGRLRRVPLSQLTIAQDDRSGRGKSGYQEPFASTSASHFLTSSTAPGSSRVVVSPISCPETRERMTRRMIFPLRVFGSFSVMYRSSGTAIGPISSRTCFRRSLFSASERFAPPFRTTYATRDCPFTGWGFPTTAASATFAWLTRADSTSIVPIRWPATLITSSIRPISQRYPSSSIRAPSPVKYFPGTWDQYTWRNRSVSPYR